MGSLSLSLYHPSVQDRTKTPKKANYIIALRQHTHPQPIWTDWTDWTKLVRFGPARAPWADHVSPSGSRCHTQLLSRGLLNLTIPARSRCSLALGTSDAYFARRPNRRSISRCVSCLVRSRLSALMISSQSSRKSRLPPYFSRPNFISASDW